MLITFHSHNITCMRKLTDEIVVNNLKLIRTNIGMSQEVLARKAKVGLRAYQKIERWEVQPSGLFLLNIAKALNEKPERVFFVIDSFDLEKYKKQYKISKVKKL